MNPRSIVILLIAVLIVIVAGALYFHLHSRGDTGSVAHVENSFEFMIDASMETAAPLFGAWKEREWAGETWNPQFLFPMPPRDVAGSVFTVAHSHSRATWVNTAFDGDHIQYVYVIPGVQAVVIDIRLTAAGGTTRAHVVYRRTALNSNFNRKNRGTGPAGSFLRKGVAATDRAIPATKGLRQGRAFLYRLSNCFSTGKVLTMFVCF